MIERLNTFLTSERKLSLCLISSAIILILFHFKPLIFENYMVGGADVKGSVGASKQYVTWQNQTGEQALWNPAIFGGVPTYYSLPNTVLGLDDGFRFIGRIFPNHYAQTLIFYIVGLIGFFLLLRHFKFSPFIAIYGGLAYVFSVHWAILLEVGHFAKYRPLMMIPLVFWSFLRLEKKKDILSAGLFSLILATQIRTFHVQIVFYTAILLSCVGVYFLVEQIRAKDHWKKFISLVGIAIILALGTTAQELMTMSEYSKSTMRGGNGETGAKKTTGLSYDYATSWSLDPVEMGEFIIPRFAGGGARETYDGGSPQFSHLIGQKIPGYHGTQPIREGSADYMGVVTLFFAIIGLIAQWKNPFVRVLFGVSVLSLFIAFGKHLPIVYDFFYNYVPFFNKFRIPSMVLVLLQTTFPILAGFGLHAMITSERKQDLLKPLYISAGVLGGLGLLFFLFSGSLNYISPNEVGRIKGDQLSALTTLREDLFVGDVKRLLMFVVGAFIISFVYLQEILKEAWKFCTVVILLVLIDLVPMHYRYMLGKDKNGQYVYLSKSKNFSSVPKTKTDTFILQQKRSDLEFADFRIYPVVQNVWNTNDYSYYHQSIGGYSATKMRAQQDLMDFGKFKNSWLFHRNIPDMLNAKYYVVDATLPASPPFENLELVFTDGKRNTYLNKNAPGKAWFVGQVEVVSTKKKTFAKLTSDTFNPAKEALVQKPLKTAIEAPVNDSVYVTAFNPNTLKLYVENEKQSFLVVSDAYYKNGWVAKIDGKETEIFRTNHMLRGIVVPSGSHEITFTFMPKSFEAGNQIGRWSAILAFLLLFVGIGLEVKRSFIDKEVQAL